MTIPLGITLSLNGTQPVENGLARVSKGVEGVGVSAAQTAAAMRMIPAQFTDIVTGLASGQAPLTVLLQQGGQLKDMFGGAGEAAKALGTYVVGLINPFTLVAAAAATVAVAYNQGSKEADAYRLAIVSTGNAVGTTTGQLQGYAQEISNVIGTQGKAAESLAAFVSTGKVSRDVLKEAAQSAVAWERATGQAVGTTAKQFADLAKDPLQAVLQLNQGTNFLTESVYKQIKSLDDQGRAAEAAAVAQRAYADALTSRSSTVTQNLGYIEKAWQGITGAAKKGWDAMLNVGRSSTPADATAELRARLNKQQEELAAKRAINPYADTSGLEKGIEVLKQRIGLLESDERQTRRNAEAEAARAAQNAAAVEWDKEGAKYLSDKAKEERDLAKARNEGLAAGKSSAEIETRLAQIRESYAKKGGSTAASESKELRERQRIYAELAGVSSTYYSDLAAAQEQRAKGNIGEAEYVKYVEELIQKQPFAVAQEKERAQAIKDSAKVAAESSKALSAWYEARERDSQGLAGQIASRREEVALMGMTTEAVLEYTRAKFEQQAAEKEAYAAALESASFYAGEYAGAYRAAAEAARQQAAQLRELGGLEVEKANKDAAKKSAEEWRRASDDINRSLTDALMRGFESGKDFAENLRDTVSNMFRTLVLRPIISAAMSPVAGAINGMLYGNTAAAAGGGANALGMIGSGANLINGLQGTQGVLGTVGGWLGMNTAAANAGLAATIGIDAASATAAANAAASAGSGLMGTIGAAMPWIAGAAAIMSIVSSLDDSGTYHTGGAAQYSAARGLSAGQSGADYNIGFGRVEAGAETISAVGGVAKGIATALDSVALAFGRTAGYEVAAAFARDTSEDPEWAALRISQGGRDLTNLNDDRASKWAPREVADGDAGWQQFLGIAAQEMRDIVLGMDLSTWAEDMVKSLGDAPSIDQLGTVLAQIAQVQSAFVSLGKSMEMFSGLSEDMQSGLLKASGSIDALTSNAGAFYQGFFSEAERVDALTAQLNSSLSKFDLSIDPAMGEAAKAQFRAAVEGAFAAGNAEMASGLLALSSSFSMAADYFAQPAKERAAQEASTLANLAKDQAALWADLAEAQGDMATAAERRYLLETQGMTQAEEAAYKYNAELRKQVSAAQQAASAISGLLTDRFDLENQLLTQAGQGDLVQQRIDQRDLAELTKGLPEAEAAKVREQFEANIKLRDQYAANQRAIDNLAKAMEEMERQQNAAAQAQRSMLQGTVTSAQNAVTQLKSIFDTLDSSIASLRGSVASAAEQDSRAAREYIAQASVLMRSGSVVDAGRLQAAVRSATAGIDNQQFANSNEADFERLKLAGELAGLKDSTAGQLTVAEQHLSIAESQLAALEYIASSISSLAGAQQAAAGQPRDQWATVSGQQVYASSGGAVGLATGSGIDIYGKDGSRFTGGEAIAYVRNQLAANDEMSVYAAAVRTGISSKALDELMGWQAGTSSAWAELNKLPKFEGGGWHAGGLRVVGERGWEVEATGPARYWNQQQLANAMNGGGSAALEEEVRAMRAELAQLRAVTQAVAEAAGATADVLVRVTNNGNGMVTAAAPI